MFVSPLTWPFFLESHYIEFISKETIDQYLSQNIIIFFIRKAIKLSFLSLILSITFSHICHQILIIYPGHSQSLVNRILNLMGTRVERIERFWKFLGIKQKYLYLFKHFECYKNPIDLSMKTLNQFIEYSKSERFCWFLFIEFIDFQQKRDIDSYHRQRKLRKRRCILCRTRRTR